MPRTSSKRTSRSSRLCSDASLLQDDRHGSRRSCAVFRRPQSAHRTDRSSFRGPVGRRADGDAHGGARGTAGVGRGAARPSHRGARPLAHGMAVAPDRDRRGARRRHRSAPARDQRVPGRARHDRSLEPGSARSCAGRGLPVRDAAHHQLSLPVCAVSAGGRHQPLELPGCALLHRCRACVARRLRGVRQAERGHTAFRDPRDAEHRRRTRARRRVPPAAGRPRDR